MLSNRAQTVETKEFTLVTLTKTFESEAPKKILAFDIDDTMLDCKMSELLHIPCIKREEELRKALYTAKKNEFLLVIVTSRSYAKQKQLESRPFLSIDNLLEKLGDDYFSGIYFTTNKHSALSDLSQRFNTKQVCLVDDMEFNRSPDFGFFQINDVDVYQRMHQFISPTTHTAPLLSEMKGSPLSLAASLENIPLLKTLVSFGDKENHTLLFDKIVSVVKNFVREKNYKNAEEIIQLFPNILSTDTLTQWAVGADDPLLIQLIGKYNKRALDGQAHARLSPLHAAVSLFSEDCLTALIDAKADLEITNHENMTPLQHAFRYGAMTPIKILLNAGANPSANGRKPSECIYHPMISAKVTLTCLENYIETHWPEEEKRPPLAQKHLNLIRKSKDHIKTLENIQESVKKDRSDCFSPCFFSITEETPEEYLQLFKAPNLLDQLVHFTPSLTVINFPIAL